MSRKLMTVLAVTILLALLLAPAMVSAHETIQVNGYDVEYGWLNEPVIVGQANAIVLNIGKPAAAAEEHTHAASISLTGPADGASVQGDHVDVAVAFEGLADDATADGVHWHLTVDGEVLSMVPLHQTSVTVSGLGDGEHMLEASLADASHDMLGDAATAKVTVTGGAATNAPAASGVEALGETGDHTHADAYTDVDVSNLKIEVTYGGETKALTLQPLGEDTPGQFIAPLTPTRAGQFTVRLWGKIDQTDINPVEVQPEEVQSVDIVAFPKAASEESDSEGLGLAGWLGIGGIVLGLAGVVLGGLALARRK